MNLHHERANLAILSTSPNLRRTKECASVFPDTEYCNLHLAQDPDLGKFGKNEKKDEAERKKRKIGSRDVRKMCYKINLEKGLEMMKYVGVSYA